MADVLANLTVQEVAAFYGRLASLIEKNKGTVATPIAPLLLREWLKNRDPKAVLALEMPSHLKSHTLVIEVLKYHRRVFLTEEKTKAGTWGGVIPRWQDGRWKGVGELKMQYESLVEFPLRYQITGDDADKDLLYALHGFQLRSNVGVTLVPPPLVKNINFSFFEARVVDRYDWDYSEHLTVPNPDYNNPSGVANPVSPSTDKVVVYHSNAQRIEKAGLAAPYDIVSKPWTITDLAISGPASVNFSKSL
jgi:hypothetical protein